MTSTCMAVRLVKSQLPSHSTLYRDKYNGGTPTAKYITNFYKKQLKSIKSHLQKEVKKRDAEVLAVDVSYKSEKKGGKVKGKALFGGLYTGVNGLGEIRLLVRMSSDNHEQLGTPLEAFKRTTEEYGLNPVQYVFTDDPRRDAQFYKDTFPSLLEKQRELDGLSPRTADQEFPLFPFNPYNFSWVLATDAARVNSKICAVLKLAKGQVIGLDTEWKVTFGRQNRVLGQDPIGCIQLGYVDESDNLEKALLVYTGPMKRKADGTKPNLPSALTNLFGDSTITLAAINLSGDISKLKKDFNLDSALARRGGRGLVDLGDFAVRRSVADRSVGLQSLLGILFKKRILKERSALFSDWNTRKPTSQQNRYV